MGYQVLAFQVPQRVLELHQLDEQVVLRVEAGGMHRALEVKTQPFLDAAHSAALCEVQKEDQVQHERRGKNTVAAEKIDFDLHGITEPSVDVDVVPSFFIVSSRRIIVDPHLVREILVKIRIELGLQNLIQHRKFALLLRLERLRIVQYLAVSIAQNVRRKPSTQAQHTRLQSGRDDGFHQCLARLEILSADRHTLFLSQLGQRWNIHREIRRSVRERNTLAEGRVGVNHARRDRGIVRAKRLFESRQRGMRCLGFHINLGASAPDHD